MLDVESHQRADMRNTALAIIQVRDTCATLQAKWRLRLECVVVNLLDIFNTLLSTERYMF